MKRRRNPEPRNTLSTSDMARAAKKILALANNEGITAAVCGGFAMHLFGSDRLTYDVDLLGSDRLPLPSTGTLTFGGQKFRIDRVPVDWIVRDDDQAAVYQEALADRTKINGMWVIRPEWMALIKFLAKRDKDQSDLLWLLSSGLFPRKHLERIVKRILNGNAYMVLDEFDVLYEEAKLADRRNRRHNA